MEAPGLGGTLDSVDLASLDALAEHVVRLNHDLGKYVCFQVRWLGEDPEPSALRGAVEADLLCTRRGPDGSRSAASVWQDFRPALFGEAMLPSGIRVDLSRDPDVAQLEDGMRIIAAVSAALGADEGGDDVVQRGAEAARRVSEACRSLARRVRAKGA